MGLQSLARVGDRRAEIARNASFWSRAGRLLGLLRPPARRQASPERAAMAQLRPIVPDGRTQADHADSTGFWCATPMAGASRRRAALSLGKCVWSLSGKSSQRRRERPTCRRPAFGPCAPGNGSARSRVSLSAPGRCRCPGAGGRRRLRGRTWLYGRDGGGGCPTTSPLNRQACRVCLKLRRAQAVVLTAVGIQESREAEVRQELERLELDLAPIGLRHGVAYGDAAISGEAVTEHRPGSQSV